MSQRFVIAGFATEEDILKATEAAQCQGWHIVDVYTPYAVHGLERAMKLPASRLPVICFLCGAIGAVFALWFQTWTLAVDWPINVGGRPWNSLPAYAPAAFEVAILLAGCGVVLAFLVRSRLYPGKKALLPASDITDNCYVLLLQETDAAFDFAQVRRLFDTCNSIFVEEREMER